MLSKTIKNGFLIKLRVDIGPRRSTGTPEEPECWFRSRYNSGISFVSTKKNHCYLKKEPIKKNQLGFSRKSKNQLNLISTLKGGLINYNPPVVLSEGFERDPLDGTRRIYS